MSDRPTIHDLDEEEMNLTPLLDVIFILLFFFLVASTLSPDERRVEVNLPQTSSEARPSDSETIQIVLTAEHEIRIGDDIIAKSNLHDHLSAMLAEEPGQRIEIFADAEAQMQAFAQVATVCSDLGVPVDLRTQPVQE